MSKEFFIQEHPLAFLERLTGIEKKQHGIRSRDVAVRDVRSLQRQIIHAWRIDQNDSFSKDLGRVKHFQTIDFIGESFGTFFLTNRKLAHFLELHRLPLA